LSQTGYGAAVCARDPGVSVARLNHPDAAELCLTWPVIQRLGDVLVAGGRILTRVSCGPNQGVRTGRARNIGAANLPAGTRMLLMLDTGRGHADGLDQGPAGLRIVPVVVGWHWLSFA